MQNRLCKMAMIPAKNIVSVSLSGCKEFLEKRRGQTQGTSIKLISEVSGFGRSDDGTEFSPRVQVGDKNTRKKSSVFFEYGIALCFLP